MKKAAGRRSFYAFFCLRARDGYFAAPAASRCCACGRGMGRFVPRHEYLSFFVKRKVPKKTTQTYGLRIPWRGDKQVLRLRARDGEFRAPARVTFFCCQKKVTKENHSNLRFKDPLARGGFRRCGGEQVLRLRARDGEFRAPARVTFFCCQKKVTKENHLDLRSKGPLARGGQVQIWRYALAHEVRWVTLSVQGTACTSCAAAADAVRG